MYYLPRIAANFNGDPPLEPLIFTSAPFPDNFFVVISSKSELKIDQNRL